MDKPKSPLASDRDGTSQAQRLLPALQTDYVAIDEHSVKDQLALAHAFAQELKYFNFDNVEAGDWQRLINPDGLADQKFWDWLQQIEDFIKQPENYADDSYYNLHRPHFVLFLTFLQLLKNTQAQLNQLTARHLEFYYRKVLNFTLKPPQPDRVNILVTPSTQVTNTLLPAGTLLEAGKDSLGKELVYSTDSDLVINHTTVARLSSVYVNKQVIGIREARELTTGTKEDKVMAMLKMALGDPAPGDDLPPYPPNKIVDFNLLTSLQSLVKFVGSGLFMELGELRSLIQLKHNRDGTAADSDWKTINGILTKAGKKQAGPSFTLKNTDPSDRHFDENLKDALGIGTQKDYLDYFNKLYLVKNINQLYEQYTSKDVVNIDDLDNFITKKLYLDDINDFIEMMRIKRSIDNEWQDIYTLLERAGQRMPKEIKLDLTVTEPPDFEESFQSALGKPSYPQISGIATINDLDSFYKALLDIEAYFFMPLEDFGLLMDTANSSSSTLNDLVTSGGASNPVWPIVYEKLAAAHQKKGSIAHKNQLTKLRPVPAKATAEAQKQAIQAMMQMVLGLPNTDTSNFENYINSIKELLHTDKALSFEKANNDKADLLTDTEWDSVCSQLELAWRNRVPIPVAQTSNWLSLSAISDTLSAKALASSDASRWYTFGQRQAKIFTVKDEPPTTAIHWLGDKLPAFVLSTRHKSSEPDLGIQSGII